MEIGLKKKNQVLDKNRFKKKYKYRLKTKIIPKLMHLSHDLHINNTYYIEIF